MKLKPAQMTPAEALTEATKGLTRKQAEFVRQLTENKKMSGTQAALRAYNTEDHNTAAVEASRLLRKPNIISALDRHNELIEHTIVGTIRDWGKSQSERKREIALDAAKFAHDKLHGKATQRVEQQSVSVTIDVDLS